MAAADRINHKILFHHGDVTETRRLNPVTHVHMFEVHSLHQFCMGFGKVDVRERVQRAGLGHVAVVEEDQDLYARLERGTHPLPAPAARRPVDVLFTPGLDLIGQSSIKSLLAQVNDARKPFSPAPPHAACTTSRRPRRGQCGPLRGGGKGRGRERGRRGGGRRGDGGGGRRC